VEDHPAVRDAIARYLEASGIQVIGTAARGDDGAALVARARPDVVVVDLALPGLPGIVVARDAARAGARVVIYSGQVGNAEFHEAFGYGVRGFVMKDAPLEDISRAVQAVHRGDSFIDPSLHPYIDGGAQEPLSPRELEILQLASDGLSVQRTAETLGISPSTVRSHIASIEHKLSANDRAHAVAKALRQSLIS